jgi:hypothetical protein
VKDENGDLLADSHNILSRWKNYFSQLFNVHRISDVRQIKMHTAELLIPDHSPFNVEIAIAKLIKFRQNLFKQEVKYYVPRFTYSFILFGIRKNCLISGRSLVFYQFTSRAIKPTEIIIGE